MHGGDGTHRINAGGPPQARRERGVGGSSQDGPHRAIAGDDGAPGTSHQGRGIGGYRRARERNQKRIPLRKRPWRCAHRIIRNLGATPNQTDGQDGKGNDGSGAKK